MNYKYLRTTEEVEEIFPALMGRKLWAVDTETSGLDPHVSKVVLLQIGNEEVQYVIDTRRASIEPLRAFFESREIKKIGHNLKFDYKMLKGSFGIELENSRDTFLAERLLHMGRKFQGFGLSDVLSQYLGLEMDKSVRSSFGTDECLRGDFSREQIEYAARDVKHLIPLAREQARLLEKDSLQHVWVLECDALPAFGDMELGGIGLDRGKWKDLMDDNTKKALEIKKNLDEVASNFVTPDLFGEIDVNYSSPNQVVHILRLLGIKVREKDPATGRWEEVLVSKSDDKTLKKIKGVPFVQLLKQYRSYMVRLNTFGQPYLDAVHPKTGMIHPEFSQIGTETGRPAKAPRSPVNMLNIPREAAMRNCFTGREGEQVETDDFSGCELRIWAHISKDPELTRAFKDGIDVHCYVASKLYGVSVTKSENSHLRAPAKGLNFGIAYGMGATSLYERLNGDGFQIELAQAKELFSKYCREFSVGVNFLRSAGRLAAEQGYLHNLLGRRRYWVKPDPAAYPKGERDEKYQGALAAIEREGGNFLIQSVNADITKYAMVLIRDYKKQNKVKSEFVNQVYDEIVTRTKSSQSEEFHAVKLSLMKKAAERWITSVPIEVDGHAGPCWTK